MINSVTNAQNSEEIREIIGQIPNWVVRWGITFSLLVLIMVLCISNYLYFPVTLAAKAIFVSEQKPYRISWKPGESQLNYQLLTHDQDKVNKNDTILIETNLETQKKRFYQVPFASKIVMFGGSSSSSEVSFLMALPDSSRYHIELMVPQNGVGQVKCGQKVLVRIDEFPESKYGFLLAEISSCDLVELDSLYRFKIRLVNGMRTNTNQIIPWSITLNGKAEIIIENVSVFNKIFSGILR